MRGMRTAAGASASARCRPPTAPPTEAALELRPLVEPDPADDLEAVGAARLDHRDLALREIRRPGERMERIAVAGDDEVFALGHGRAQQLAQAVVALRVVALQRSAADLGHRR